MFFKTSIKQKDGIEYTHYQLCDSWREGCFIRNRTLLFPGDLESDLPPEKIPLLCKRINRVYREGKTLMISLLRDDKVESLCTKYVKLLREAQKIEKADRKAIGIEQVYIDRTTNSDIGEVGGEWLCLQACRQLLLWEYPEILAGTGRMPSWLLRRSSSGLFIPPRSLKPAVGCRRTRLFASSPELPPSTITKNKLYRMAFRLHGRKDGPERHFSDCTNDLFSLDDKIIIYDFTNTCFEGRMQGSNPARFGRSKEKRNDAGQVEVDGQSDSFYGDQFHLHIPEGRDDEQIKTWGILPSHVPACP